ncbi:MAG: hypothetical protein OXP28_09880 [Gammaproteobacteria bacterium]|nr:hypothetical protein [Gammaproteobacteria bacterium]MDE0225432.1 hypothetical protein [Gammaproteobacteria bacterium]
MNKATRLACLTALVTCLSVSAWGADSIEAARAAYAEGAFTEAADLGEALGTVAGNALAAEALAIYAHYVAEEEEREPLLQRAMGAADKAVELDPESAEAHLQSAHAVGRYSQLFSPMKALQEGYPKQVRASIERALELDPDHFGAHLSLASWHAEAIGRGGMMARALLGANRKTAHAHFEQAMALAPERNVVLVEYAWGLMLLERRKARERAQDLLERAIELPPKDAYEKIVNELAVERLAALDGEAR